MHPTVAQQLGGMARILGDVVAPEVDATYASDMLAGVIAALDGLAAAHDHIEPFLVWDADATVAVLSRAGIAVDDVPDETPADRHTRVRGLLEESMPTIVADPDARAAMLALFRDRVDRFPLTLSPGGQRAHQAR